MKPYASEEEYVRHLVSIGRFPEGISGSVTSLLFTPNERPSEEPYRMDMSLIHLEEPTESFAAVFTKNALCGAPITIGRRRLQGAKAQTIVVNNRISNVCAPQGEADALEICSELARLLGSDPDHIFPVSTGIIGWSLPISDMKGALPAMVARRTQDSAAQVARAIMTTDRFPKLRSAPLGEGTIVAMAKGAGMIEPNMATMLAFVVTDVQLDRTTMERVLRDVVGETFNSISVDSDQSTSDMVLFLSSNKKPGVSEAELHQAMLELCGGLAEDIVRNGEGVGHLIQCRVQGADTDDNAKSVAKALVNSPLVKTAIYGNDPNVGRIVGAIGDHCGNHGIAVSQEDLSISIGGIGVFYQGAFRLDKEKEIKLKDYMQVRAMNPRLKGFPQGSEAVAIEVHLGQGEGDATVLGSDLTDVYVHENADYRT